MLRSNMLRLKAENLGSADLSAKKKAMLKAFLLEQAEQLEGGNPTPAFRDGNVQVCSECGFTLEKGCCQYCVSREAGFTYMERIRSLLGLS